MLRARVIETLSARFDSRVELGYFHVYVLNGLEVTGGDLHLYPNDLDMQAPLFAVRKFSFKTGWRSFLHTPMHVGRVNLEGLALTMPPKEDRKNMPKMKNGEGGGKIQIYVDQLLVKDAKLVLETNKPGKTPLEWDISNLALTSIGAGQPLAFHAILTNPKPVGNIDSTGHFGPFNTESPGDTPIDGAYNFSHADLNSLKGIGGMLSSQGKYVGSISVTTGGVIVVRYTGSQANAKLSAAGNNILSLNPGLDANYDVIWVCGTASTPTNVSVTTAATTTTVVASYLPNSCHA